MLPYYSPAPIEIGPVSISAFKLSLLTAVVVGLTIVVYRAPSNGVSRRDALGLVNWAMVLAFLGSRAFSLLLYQPDELHRAPLGVLRFWDSMSSFGAITGTVVGALLGKAHLKLSRRQLIGFLDTVGFALPFAWVPARVGCSLAHDHLGIHSDHWLAVDFPQGSRFDLGVLELLYVVPLAVAFAAMGRKRQPLGLYFPLFLVLYSPVRFALDYLRVGDARYLGWTPAQYAAVIATLVGIGVLIRLYQGNVQQEGDPAATCAGR